MMTQNEARNSLNVITGLLLIYNFPTLECINSRATHSFISVSHVKSLNHKIESLEGGMLVSTTSGEVFMIESVCRDCKIRIENVAS